MENITGNPTESRERNRGGCLTAFIIFVLIVYPLLGFYYLFADSTVQQAFPSAPVWMIPVLCVLSFANFIFAIGIWKWKKWGVYGVFGVGLLVFLVNTMIMGILQASLGLIGLVIWFFLLRPVWHQME